MWAYESVFYQIYPIGFCGAPWENDGKVVNRVSKIGTWAKHIVSIGCNAVYLSPVFESDSHGYDTRDFRKIDCRLGTNKNFAAVCDTLHKNGIRVVLDGVFNHVGRGFWAFRDVQKNKQNSPYKDWFLINFDGNSNYDDGFWYNGKWYSYSDGYWYDGKWYPYYPSYPSYSHRDEYTVEWSEDTYYYDGEKHVPTATITVGKRTIELNVSLTSGNGIDVGKHRVVARVPSGYSGITLDGASLYYNIEEPLKSGFVYEDGYTYYYEGGKAVTGWKTIDGDTYYFAKDGKATKGWKWLNNAWYYFGSDGKMMTEWVRDGGKIYYCYDSGVMAKSTWLKLDGYWYYFYNDGRMAESGWVLSGGKWYFLAGDGRMATNTTIPGGYYVDSTGAWVK